MKNPLIIPFLLLSLSSCMLNQKEDKKGGKIKLSDVAVNDEYSMGVPPYMKKATSLNDDASLQFQNIFKETYVIVIDENKQEFIDAFKKISAYDTTLSVLSNYTDTQLQSTTANMEVIGEKDISLLTINGLKASTTEVDANVQGVNVPLTYFFTFIEGEQKLYFIMAWTLQSKKDEYKPAFDEMARSFKLLK